MSSGNGRGTSTADGIGGSVIRFFNQVTNGQGGIAGGGLLEFELQTALLILPLAVVFFAKILLSNLSFA